jgi:hypothetical protein
MRTLNQIILFALLIFGTFGASVAAAQTASRPLSEQEKIEQLIASIEQLSNAQFIRSGTAYSADKAAAHLRMKLAKAGNKITTARAFIDHLASTSYLTGKPYYIRYSDGRQVTAKSFFDARLREINSTH